MIFSLDHSPRFAGSLSVLLVPAAALSTQQKRSIHAGTFAMMKYPTRTSVRMLQICPPTKSSNGICSRNGARYSLVSLLRRLFMFRDLT